MSESENGHGLDSVSHQKNNVFTIKSAAMDTALAKSRQL